MCLRGCCDEIALFCVYVLQRQCYLAGDSLPPSYGYEHGHPSSAVLASPGHEEKVFPPTVPARGEGVEERRGLMQLEPLRAPLEMLKTEKTPRHLSDSDSEEGVYLDDDFLKKLSGQSNTHSREGVWWKLHDNTF